MVDHQWLGTRRQTTNHIAPQYGAPTPHIVALLKSVEARYTRFYMKLCQKVLKDRYLHTVSKTGFISVFR
jgi:hypothetical protein